MHNINNIMYVYIWIHSGPSFIAKPCRHCTTHTYIGCDKLSYTLDYLHNDPSEGYACMQVPLERVYPSPEKKDLQGAFL